VGRPAPDFSNQVHDFNPGFGNGLFWTIPLDRENVRVDPGSGRASMVVRNLELGDHSNIRNSLTGGPFNPATASFEIQWAPGMKRFKVRDEAIGIAGEFVMNSATMVWPGQSLGQEYLCGPRESSASTSAQIGHERNGVFCPHRSQEPRKRPS
jgi:hypothetical protein